MSVKLDRNQERAEETAPYLEPRLDRRGSMSGMRLPRLLAAFAFVAVGASLWAAPALAADPKVTVYPQIAAVDDPIVVTVENVACVPSGQVKLLFNGAEPGPGAPTNAGWGFHFYGDDSLILEVLPPLQIPPAGHNDIAVSCTDGSGNETTYRSGFERTLAEEFRPYFVPWRDDPNQNKNYIQPNENCEPSVNIEGQSVAVLQDGGGPYFAPPNLTPGLHMATVNCGGRTASYPIAIDGLRSGSNPVGLSPTPQGGDNASDAMHIFLSVPTPDTVSFAPVKVATAVLLGGVVIVLIGFPAEFVNKTIEANEDEINSWFRGARGSLRRLTSSLKPWQWFLVYCALTALLTTFVDPLAGFNLTTLITLLSFVIAVPLTTIVYSGVREAYTRRITGVPGILHTVPRALLLAFVMTIASRLAGFQPGYVYGLVAGYISLRERRLTAQRDGSTVVAGSAALFVISVASWIALGSVHGPASLPDAGFPMRLWDGVLCATFLLGVQTLVFGLIPLRFLDGHVLRDWSVRVWAFAYAPGIVLFIFLLGLNSETARQRGVASGLFSSLVLFIAFGAASMLFWAFFQIHKRSSPPATVLPRQPSPTTPQQPAEQADSQP